ncbi:MAG: lysostaphin resistance A-like protein [Phycisphaerales bacterium]
MGVGVAAAALLLIGGAAGATVAGPVAPLHAPPMVDQLPGAESAPGTVSPVESGLAGAPEAEPADAAPPVAFGPREWAFFGLAFAAAAVVVARRLWTVPSPRPPRAIRRAPHQAFLCAGGMVIVAVLVASTGSPPDPDASLTIGEQLMRIIPIYAAQALVLVAWWGLLRAPETGPGAEPVGALDARAGGAVAAGAAASTAVGPPLVTPVAPVTPGRAALVGLIGLALTWPIANAVGALAGLVMTRLGRAAPDPVAHRLLEDLLAAPIDGAFVGMILLVTLAVPLLEEALYRGMVQGGMVGAGIGSRVAIVATSLVFTVMHVGAADAHALVALFVMSLGFGLVVERTGRLLAGVVMHGAFNAGNLILAFATLG